MTCAANNCSQHFCFDFKLPRALSWCVVPAWGSHLIHAPKGSDLMDAVPSNGKYFVAVGSAPWYRSGQHCWATPKFIGPAFSGCPLMVGSHKSGCSWRGAAQPDPLHTRASGLTTSAARCRTSQICGSTPIWSHTCVWAMWIGM